MGLGRFSDGSIVKRKLHYETKSVGVYLIHLDLDRNHYLFVGDESMASPVELGNSGTVVIPRPARSDYDHNQEANQLNSGSQSGASLEAPLCPEANCRLPGCKKAYVSYFFHAGNALRADFSLFNPRAQSACINVWMSRVPS